MIRNLTLVLLLSVGAGTLLPAGASVQTGTSRSVWDGVYADDQSKRGESLALATCVSCHGEELSGASRKSVPCSAGATSLQSELSAETASVNDIRIRAQK